MPRNNRPHPRPGSEAPRASAALLPRFSGTKLRAAREALAMTPEELCAASGISAATLRRFETGSHTPRYDTAIALARAVHVALDDLAA